MSNVMRQTYRTLSVEEQERVDTVKRLHAALHRQLVAVEGADQRCLMMAKTKLEEAVMWAVKGLTL